MKYHRFIVIQDNIKVFRRIVDKYLQKTIEPNKRILFQNTKINLQSF